MTDDLHLLLRKLPMYKGGYIALRRDLAHRAQVERPRIAERSKFGAIVTIVDEDTREKRRWQIVGEPEADASRGKISVFSPLARALIGKTKNATVEVLTPSGAKAYKISNVQWG